MKNSSTSSISGVTLLTLIFVVLKLTHVIVERIKTATGKTVAQYRMG